MTPSTLRTARALAMLAFLGAGQAHLGLPSVHARAEEMLADQGGAGDTEPVREKKSWSNMADLGVVATGGNAESQSLAFGNVFKRTWTSSGVEVTAAGIRTETTDVTRTAIGTPTSFSVVEAVDTETTAETYQVGGRYDRTLTDRFFWHGGGGWDRNRPAGIENRYTAFSGVGNIWLDTDKHAFKTDYALTYTDQEEVTPNPATGDTFVGFRFSWDYRAGLGTSTVYENKLILNENLDETDDLRIDFLNAVSVSMSSKLALKVSLRILFDNEPAFEEIDLFDMPGGAMTGTVPVQLDEVDTYLTVSLVVDF